MWIPGGQKAPSERPCCSWCLLFSPPTLSLTLKLFSIHWERLLLTRKRLICILSPQVVLCVTWFSVSHGALCHVVLRFSSYRLSPLPFYLEIYMLRTCILYIMKVTTAAMFKRLQWLWIHPHAVTPSPLLIYRMYAPFALTYCVCLIITHPCSQALAPIYILCILLL